MITMLAFKYWRVWQIHFLKKSHYIDIYIQLQHFWMNGIEEEEAMCILSQGQNTYL